MKIKYLDIIKLITFLVVLGLLFYAGFKVGGFVHHIFDWL